jgi:hypothetical protein
MADCLRQSNLHTHIQPYSPLPRYSVVGTDTAIVAIMTEVFIRPPYEVYMKMSVRVNLSMIVHWEFYRLSRKPYVGLKIISYYTV